MVALHTLVFVAVAVFALALLAGLGAVCVRALALWRSVRRLRRSLGSELEQTSRSLAGTEARLAAVGAHAKRLEESRERLSATLADARVLLAAAQEAWALVARVRALVPGR